MPYAVLHCLLRGRGGERRVKMKGNRKEGGVEGMKEVGEARSEAWGGGGGGGGNI